MASSAKSTVVVALLTSVLGACAAPLAFPDPPPPLPAEGRRLVMVDGTDGTALDWPDLVARARTADVVLVGETHQHPEGLAAAAFLFEDLLAADPDGPTLALEFFERDAQVALDDLVSGVIDEAALVERLDLTPSRLPPGHRAMVRAAVDAGRAVWAANAPRRYVRRARTHGFEDLRALGPAQRALFVVPEAVTPGAYRDRFVEAMTGHGVGAAELDVDGMYRSQNLWDATMADTVLRARAAGGRPVVLVVGRFHVEYDGGLRQRLHATAPALDVLTLAVLAVDADTLRQQDEGRADVVVYAGGAPDG